MFTAHSLLWWSPMQALTVLDVTYYSERVAELALIATTNLVCIELMNNRVLTELQ